MHVFFNIVDSLRPSRCRAHRGRQDASPSSERVLRLFATRPRSFEGVGCPVGVAVTIAGGGDVFFVLLFLSSRQTKNRPRERSDRGCFFHRQLREPISTNPGPMEASEYGLICWTCFVTRRPEEVAVAGLLWISSCVLGGAIFFVFFIFILFFYERTRPTARMRPPRASFTPLLVPGWWSRSPGCCGYRGVSSGGRFF